MPLSEDEQRILRQIEEQLQRDPNFARDLAPEPRGSRRSLFLSVVGTVIAIALCVLLLAVSPYVAFVAFLVAMVGLVRVEQHARLLGDEALRQVSAMRRQRPGSGASH